MHKTGKCLCGAVSYSVEMTKDSFGTCHCSMCRRWTGGIFLGFEAQPDKISFEGSENIAAFASSEWAERASCAKCGSSLYYRITAPGPHSGVYHVGVGTLDDTDGLSLTEQLFIDIKPDAYSFVQKTHDLTAAEVEAFFAAPD